MDRTPFTVGMCRDCRREMWSGTPKPPNGVKVGIDGRTCQSCENWRAHHPGGDPRLATNTHAEHVRAEWDEDDPRWRRRGNCRGSDEPEIFNPAPDPDERPPTWTAEVQRKTHQYAADAYCSFCPVLLTCRGKAEFHGYEGVWGGAVFERETWTCLLTGASGPTIHHRARKVADRGYPPAVSTTGLSAEDVAA